MNIVFSVFIDMLLMTTAICILLVPLFNNQLLVAGFLAKLIDLKISNFSTTALANSLVNKFLLWDR